MNLTLRDYQSNILTATQQSFRTGHRRPLITLPCGAGKTVCFASMARSAQSRGKTVWFLVHRRELLDQTTETFDRFDIPRRSIYIGMVGTVANNIARFPKPDLIIFDECFPANTLVDGIAIETINVGDTVSSYNHDSGIVEGKSVTHVFKKPVGDRLIRINGSLVCTPNHPIFITERGDYIAAESIVPGNSMLRRVRKVASDGGTAEVEARPVSRKGKDVLLDRMFIGVQPETIGSKNEEHEFARRRENIGAHESAESDGASRCAGKGFTDDESERLQASHSGRERAGIYGAAEEIAVRPISAEPDRRIYRENAHATTERVAASDALQIGRGDTAQEGCDRDRRRFAQIASHQSDGREENAVFEIVRVESIEVLERGRDGEFERLCPDGHVYNLEVEGNSNYFAGGYLVHNCHHSSAATWQKIINAFPDAFITGLTATPCRLDGKPLGTVYDDLIIGATTRELIDQGYLAPYRYFAPAVADLSTLKRRGKDYDATQAAELLSERAVFGDVIKHYREYADGLQAIAYCSTVAHSERTAEEFNLAGISAVSFDGTTPAAERKRITQDYRDGRIKILCNCDLVGEGFDVPDCHVCILLRPTMSTGLFIQQSMRCMRPQPGKTAIILDHVNNYQRHGLPDDPRDWSLTDTIKPRREYGADGLLTVRQCPMCYYTFKSGPPFCPNCGAPIQKTREEIKNVKDIKLAEIKQRRIETAREKVTDDTELSECRTLAEFQAYAKIRGYKSGWAYITWKRRIQGRATV